MKAQSVLAGLPIFAGQDTGAFKITRLGGLTNLVFRVEAPAGVYCLRLPGEGTEVYIDRKIGEQGRRAH